MVNADETQAPIQDGANIFQSSCAGLPPSLKLWRPLKPVARRSLGVDGTRASIALRKKLFSSDGLPDQVRQ
jgi:hypothetical protein